MSKISVIQFIAPRDLGARIVASVFQSLPQEGEEAAWDNPEAAKGYCDNYPEERMDVGGYYRPNVYVPPTDALECWEGVTGISTASRGRLVTFYPPSNFWSVDFGESLYAAAQLLAAIDKEGIEPSCITTL